ncbi:MAG: hypothetical protein ACFNNB_03055 [Candidatus Saccharimonas sp.]
MKHDLLTLTDSLILQKDVDDLVRLRHIILELYSSGFEVEKLSLIELNEYIDEAGAALEENKDPKEIVNLKIRQLQNS